MSAEIRICPNCGASVVGHTPHCPRCDFPLDDAKATPNHVEDSFEDDVSSAPTTEGVLPAEGEDPAREDEEEALSLEETEERHERTPTPAQMADLVAKARAMPRFEEANTADFDPALMGASIRASETQRAVTPPAPPLIEPTPPLPTQTPPLERIPAAPYTPPPLREHTVSVNPYAYPSNYYLEQRIAAYRLEGYHMKNFSPYQAVMTYGKPLGFLWWLVALFSGVGFLWYLIILLSSGFSQDRVYLIIERDGALSEDGAGAAHVRRARARVGRRWGFVGVMVLLLALAWFIVMMGAAFVGMSRYGAELEAAYPALDIFQTDDETAPLSVSDESRATAESAVLVFSILLTLSVVALVGGLTMMIIGYIHGAAYDVRVPPLPT